MTPVVDEVVVLARGGLADESGLLALRMALAIPLGGSRVRLLLVGAAATFGLSSPPDLGARGSQLDRELDSLLRDEEAPVGVERESLAELGLSDRELRGGVDRVSRAELEDICGRARHCLVI